MLPTKFRYIWASCVREEDFQKLTNQKKASSVAAMFVNNIYRGPSIDGSYQVSVHLVEGF